MLVRRVLMLTCAIACGCGASPRMLHQSEAYYEHCNAADLDPARSTEDRLRCWSAWVEHYREGVAPERVSHARRRLVALESGITIAPLPDVTPSYTSTFMALEAAPDGTDVATPTQAADTQHTSYSPAETNDVRPNDAARTTEAVPDAHTSEARPARDPRHVPPRPRPLARRPSSATHPCTSVCQPRWDACVDRASSRGLDGVEACRIEHRVCMNGCM